MSSVIVDPPYSERVHKYARSQPSSGGSIHNDFGFSHLSEDLRRAIAARIAEASGFSIVFCDWEGLSAWVSAVQGAGGRHIRSIPWVRWSMPQLTGDRPPQGSECVAVFHGPGKLQNYSGPGNLTHFDVKCLRGKDKHKTEKPLSLMLLLVQWFTAPGDLILDPCAGSGTTIVAAQLLGRRAVGWELQPQWVEKANARLEAARREELSLRDEAGLAEFLRIMDEEAKDRTRRSENTDKVRVRRQIKG